jgi:hypothetical protein
MIHQPHFRYPFGSTKHIIPISLHASCCGVGVYSLVFNSYQRLPIGDWWKDLSLPGDTGAYRTRRGFVQNWPCQDRLVLGVPGRNMVSYFGFASMSMLLCITCSISVLYTFICPGQICGSTAAPCQIFEYDTLPRCGHFTGRLRLNFRLSTVAHI